MLVFQQFPRSYLCIKSGGFQPLTLLASAICSFHSFFHSSKKFYKCSHRIWQLYQATLFSQLNSLYFPFEVAVIPFYVSYLNYSQPAPSIRFYTFYLHFIWLVLLNARAPTCEFVYCCSTIVRWHCFAALRTT